MALRLSFTRALLAATLFIASQWAAAQLIDAPPILLEPAERARLQAILDREVDPSQIASRQIEQFKAREVAAVALGDMVAREKNLRAWLKFDTEAAFPLRDLMAATERRGEAYELAQRIIDSAANIGEKARMSILMAENLVEDNQLERARRLLDAGKIYHAAAAAAPRGVRPPYVAYADGDTELILHYVNARHLWQSGRLADAIDAARQAAQKGRDQYKLEYLATERHRLMGRTNYLRALYLLSAAQTAAGAFTAAEATLREAYQAPQKFGYGTTHLASLYLTASDFYIANGAFGEALEFGRRGEELVLKIGFPRGSAAWLTAQRRVVTALAAMDRWPEALRRLDEVDQAIAESRVQTGLAQLPELRGMTYIRNGRPEQARKVLEEARAWYQANLGPTHHQTALAEGLLACALAASPDASIARSHFERAIGHLASPATLTGDMSETALDRKMKRFVLQGYAQLLARSAATNRADASALFKVADMLGSSSVQQALAEAAVRSGVTIPGLVDIIRKEQDAKTELGVLTASLRGHGSDGGPRLSAEVVARVRARIAELETQRKDYKQQIQKSYPEYFQLIQPRAVDPREIASQLAADELFLAIIPMEDSVYTWSIRADGTIGFHRAALAERELQQQVDAIRQTLDVAEMGAKAPRFDHGKAHALYQQLFAPFDADLEGRRHLVISASGSLAKLPFAVLPRTAAAPADPREAAWLIKDIAISHVPSASGWMSLKKLSQQPSAAEPLLAWGDPQFDPETRQVASAATTRAVLATRATGENQRSIVDAAAFLNYSRLPALPETRQEVTELARILGATPGQDLVLGRDATRASVLARNQSGQLARKQVVVFATHGLLAGDLPGLTQPALALAATRDPRESPLLTLEDVLGLKLNADWVVLSACNTAGADGRAEEALSGLARGFFYAGSRSLLVTHWSVESESAMRLTTRTFEAYKVNPALRRAEALRLAMLDTMQAPQFSHPAYWAPYALVGEGGR